MKKYYVVINGERNVVENFARTFTPYIGSKTKFGKLVTVAEHYDKGVGKLDLRWIGNIFSLHRLRKFLGDTYEVEIQR